MTRLAPKDPEQRNRVSFLSGALLLTTLVICGYIMNPLVSPVTFLRDSDLDGVQDYSDDYPNNHSRVDRPWVNFMMYTFMSYSDDEWNVRVGSGGHSCWLDATSIEIFDSNNSPVLERTLLTQLNGVTGVDGVGYLNSAKLDRLDEGDYFLIDGQRYANGSRIVIVGATDTGWQTLTMNRLAIPDAF